MPSAPTSRQRYPTCRSRPSPGGSDQTLVYPEQLSGRVVAELESEARYGLVGDRWVPWED